MKLKRILFNAWRVLLMPVSLISGRYTSNS